jgi:primosomal protein N' (replication factor Y)
VPTLFAKQAVGYARVAVERAVDRYPDGLTYAIPEELKSLAPGERVIVPLGRGDTPTAGYVIEITDSIDIDPEHIKPVTERDKAASHLSPQLLQLAKWISSYYCAPIGMTLASMLPAAVKRNIGAVRRVTVDLGDPKPLDEKLPPKQRQVLEALASVPADQRPIEINELAGLAELKTTGSIKRLIDRGLLEVSHRTEIEADWSRQAIDDRIPEQLTSEQTRIIQTIANVLLAGFSTHLLFGVTGSGKTEVYIRLIEKVIATGKVALMLVPEISLTPQTAGRLIGRFPNHRVAVLHSGLTAAQRHQQWMLVETGQADIVLGARSAIFAPIAEGRLGLIVVDEEHDSSYKQDQVPRYHGRDVAIRRAQLAKCPIVLGSATPSLESWHNAIDDWRLTIDDSDPSISAADRQSAIANRKSKYTLHRLTQRAPGLRLPKVQIVDFRHEMRQRHDRHVHLIGPLLESAIARTLDSGGQALILLNRRGYANYIACPSSKCGWVMTCQHCDVTVVYHLNKKLPAGGYVRCHHCLSEQKLPVTCPDCGSKVTPFGLGTQRVEEELARKFPQLADSGRQSMMRMDSDSMHSSRAYHDALERFGSGEIKVLLGTQMIAKGLDFPGVRLVGVINADTTINLPDFRATERTFQLVSQVAGRCGRSSEPGLTIVQTFHPGAPAIQLAAAHDFEAFAKLELKERAECSLPPITRMCRIVVRDEDHIKCIEAARGLARSLEAIAARMANGCVRLRGPAPCPISRVADKHRQQIEILADSAVLLQQFLTAARRKMLIKSDAEMVVDVDPIALL